MARKGNPPELEKNLGDRAPPYEDQARLVAAFRRFIKNPDNKNSKGRPWSPAVILERMWELWPERPDEPGAYRYFRDRNYKCFERLRSKEPKQAVDDVLQLTLIERFLMAYGIELPPPDFLKALEKMRDGAVALMACSRELPDRGGDYVPGVRVYFLTSKDDDASKDPLLLGLQLPRQQTACCPAVIFRQSDRALRVGLYFFALRECRVRGPDFTKADYATYRLFPIAEQDAAFSQQDRRMGYLPPPFLSDELLEDPQWQDFEPGKLITTARIHVVCQKFSDARALAFVTEYFINLDL